MGGGGRVPILGVRMSDASELLTLIGNRPLGTRRRCGRGVLVSSLDSSPVASASRPLMMCNFINFLICAVMVTSDTSPSLPDPSLEGLEDGICSASRGGKLIGFPSNLRTWSEVISAKQTGSSRIWFFGIERTLREVSFAISGGKTRSWLRPRSRISRDLSSQS